MKPCFVSLRTIRTFVIRSFLLLAVILPACQANNAIVGGPITISSQVTRGATLDYVGGMYDFDRTSLALETNTDIEFLATGGSMVFFSLLTINGASAVFYGYEEPGNAGCISELSSFGEISIPKLSGGSFICLLTNQEELFQIEILDLTVVDRMATIELDVRELAQVETGPVHTELTLPAMVIVLTGLWEARRLWRYKRYGVKDIHIWYRAMTIFEDPKSKHLFLKDIERNWEKYHIKQSWFMICMILVVLLLLI